jgi:hypothetical protein
MLHGVMGTMIRKLGDDNAKVYADLRLESLLESPLGI